MLTAVVLAADVARYRLFAVGYAARQIDNEAQLERLLSNPPMAPALQAVRVRYILHKDAECATCHKKFEVRFEPGFSVFE